MSAYIHVHVYAHCTERVNIILVSDPQNEPQRDYDLLYCTRIIQSIQCACTGGTLPHLCDNVHVLLQFSVIPSSLKKPEQCLFDCIYMYMYIVHTYTMYIVHTYTMYTYSTYMYICVSIIIRTCTCTCYIHCTYMYMICVCAHPMHMHACSCTVYMYNVDVCSRQLHMTIV